MIQKLTTVYAIDNSGARKLKCIHIKNKSVYGFSGDLILATVKKLRKIIPKKKVKRSQVVIALLINSGKEVFRSVGIIFKSNHNNVVIMNKEGNLPIANRFVSFVSFEIRLKGFNKVVSMCKGLY